MKMPNYHLYLTDDEYSQVIHCLVELKNKMMEQGRYSYLGGMFDEQHNE